MDEKTLNALVNAIKNKDPKGLKAYENLLKIASSKPKNEKEQKNIEAAKEYVTEIKKRLTAKAAHGAKLDYIKLLKHICPEGLEPYYYKKGGNLECGCKGIKMEEGAKVEKTEKAKKGCKAVENFKAIKKGLKGPKDTLKFKDLAARDSFYINTYGAEDLESTRPGNYVRKPNSDKPTWVPDRTKTPYNKLKGETKKQERRRREEPFEPNLRPRPRSKSTTTIKRDTSRSIKTQLQKTGGSVVEKFKSARCGSKMKKHKDGGSLNRIPFYLKGTPKSGVNLNSSIPNRPQFFIPLKVKPTNWYGSNLQQVVVFDNDSGNLYKRTRKIANNGDTFEEDITTRPYPLSSDTSYAYTSKYNGIKLGSNTIKHVSPKLYLEYDSLKNAFRKIVSKPINGVPL